ncbi:MAG: AraC family transcriptional regulator [Alphaproteobacteria bacterium]|nr:AraC family transcriptional regulator [Alphaproteobacteria bacterium]
MGRPVPVIPRRFLFETSLGVRLMFCGRFKCAPKWSIPPEKIPAALISFFFLEKNGCWATVNGIRTALRQGDLKVSRGGDILSMGHDPARPITALSVSLAVEQGVIPNILLQRKFARRYRIKDPVQYRKRFDAILQALQSPVAVREWKITGAVLQFLALILEETAAPLSAQVMMDEGTVDRILIAQTWANARLGSPLSLEQWARAVNWHPVHFDRVFKQQTGVTPMRWLNERRMQAARQFLSGTSKTVAEIAEELGYRDPFYFSRVFRRHFGQSPRQCRKQGMEFGSGTEYVE